MITVKTILCPVDFFPASEAAVMYAAGLAQNYDATVQLLHVITPVFTGSYEYAIDTTEIMDSIRATSMEDLNGLVAKVKEMGVRGEAILQVGDVYDEIKRAIDGIKPDLIVMGTHGRRGVERWFLGSTTEKLLRHSPVPLVTISAAGEKSFKPPRFERMLVTTDFSDGAPAALAHAFSVAQENESHITLLHVVHDVEADLSGKYRDSLLSGVTKQLDEHSRQGHAGSRASGQHGGAGRSSRLLSRDDDSAKADVEEESAAWR
jgi:nucleotide-binding universal stress UspA family protein